MDNQLLTIVVAPLVVGFILLFLPKQIRLLAPIVAFLVSIWVFVLCINVFSCGDAGFSGLTFEIAGRQIALVLFANPLNKFMLLFAAGFGLLITIYSLKSITAATSLGQYYGAVLLTIGGSAGVLLTQNLLYLLIFWEIVTCSLYILITTGGKNSNFAATKSFALIGASDGAFLIGILLVWLVSGTFDMSVIRLQTNQPIVVVAFLLLLLAAITKAGAMPLHTWLPASGEYAHPSVMALLPASIDKLLGIYLFVVIVRNLFILTSSSLQLLLVAVGAFTIIIAVMMAMVQHNLKKLLAYHAISQVGYMILGIATFTPIGIAGGLFHMLNNAIYKCCLFLCGGAVEQATGTAELENLGGLAKKMPVTFITCLIAALSISGIPPLNGFVSKWMVYQGIINMGISTSEAAGQLWPVWLTCAMFGSALTLASFVKLIHSLFLSRLPDSLKNTKEVSFFETSPMLVLAALCVLFGVFYYVPLRMFIYPALGLQPDAVALGTWQSGLATILIIVGIGLGTLILLVGWIARKARTVPTWTCGEILPNDDMIIPGTHFYKTVSNMNGLKQMYKAQNKGWFDLYDQTGRLGLAVSGFLKWLHCGILPLYLTWVTVGLLLILYALCSVW